jgi:hypothetical protein
MKNIEKIITDIGIGCFWIAIVTELIVVIIDKSAYTNPYESWIFRITFLLFTIKAVTTKYTGKDILIVTICGLIAVTSYFVNTKDEAVRAAVFVVACKDVDLKKMLKVTLAVTGIGSIILFVLSAIGIFGVFSVTANFGRGTNEVPIIETRYCFGMGHPNAFHTMLIMMMSLILYLYTDRMKIYHFAIMEIVNILFYLFTDSKTGILVGTLMIVGVVVMKYFKLLSHSKIIYIVGALVVIGLVALSMYGSHIGRGVDEQLIFKLDRLLNGRFQYAHNVENARLENWKMFSMPENENYFDQGFIKMFYWYGIIPGALYILANLYLIYQSYKTGDYPLVVIVVAYSVMTLMEGHLISVYLLRNYLLIWMGYYWYRIYRKENLFEGYFWQIRGFLKGKNK